jgi:hypothetical protein
MQRARIIQTSTIREGLVFAKAPVFFLNRGPRKTARFIAAVTTMQARAKTQSGAAGGVKYNAKIQPASTPMLITRAFFQRRIMAGDGIPLRANYIKLRKVVIIPVVDTYLKVSTHTCCCYFVYSFSFASSKFTTS